MMRILICWAYDLKKPASIFIEGSQDAWVSAAASVFEDDARSGHEFLRLTVARVWRPGEPSSEQLPTAGHPFWEDLTLPHSVSAYPRWVSELVGTDRCPSLSFGCECPPSRGHVPGGWVQERALGVRQIYFWTLEVHLRSAECLCAPLHKLAGVF